MMAKGKVEVVLHEVGGVNVFGDLGFAPTEAASLLARSRMIVALKQAMSRRGLTQMEASKLCGTDQPTLSKLLRGRMESVTIDRLADWLTALGQDVEITVKPAPRSRAVGALRVVERT